MSFIVLLLMISFASVNAMLFTPALPTIAHDFGISASMAQHTVTWFLIGYALGQLLYGPLANRYGRKPALYMGISLQIISSVVCILAGTLDQFSLLIIGRFLLALGSGVGLKMTFTLVNEYYSPEIASQKISYLILAFAIAPGLCVALGGFLNTYWGWQSCFYAGGIYGIILLYLVSKLPETQKILDHNALKIKNLINDYVVQFKNIKLINGALLMGCSTCFVYVFSAFAPFIAINIFKMTSMQYGLANIIPSIGMLLGSLCAAQLAKKYNFIKIIQKGITLASLGVFFMLVFIIIKLPIWISVFIPMAVIYFGLTFIIANASTYALSFVSDKSHGSAVMNFLNMGLATVAVLGLGWVNISVMTLPVIYTIFCVFMMLLWVYL